MNTCSLHSPIYFVIDLATFWMWFSQIVSHICGIRIWQKEIFIACHWGYRSWVQLDEHCMKTFDENITYGKIGEPAKMTSLYVATCVNKKDPTKSCYFSYLVCDRAMGCECVWGVRWGEVWLCVLTKWFHQCHGLIMRCEKCVKQ